MCIHIGSNGLPLWLLRTILFGSGESCKASWQHRTCDTMHFCSNLLHLCPLSPLALTLLGRGHLREACGFRRSSVSGGWEERSFRLKECYKQRHGRWNYKALCPWQKQSGTGWAQGRRPWKGEVCNQPWRARNPGCRWKPAKSGRHGVRSVYVSLSQGLPLCDFISQRKKNCCLTSHLGLQRDTTPTLAPQETLRAPLDSTVDDWLLLLGFWRRWHWSSGYCLHWWEKGPSMRPAPSGTLSPPYIPSSTWHALPRG